MLHLLANLRVEKQMTHRRWNAEGCKVKRCIQRLALEVPIMYDSGLTWTHAIQTSLFVLLRWHCSHMCGSTTYCARGVRNAAKALQAVGRLVTRCRPLSPGAHLHNEGLL